MAKGRLYVVATPIGNLEDITLRALRILKEADIIAAEDTRHSLKLLNHYGISKPLISYWGEKEKSKAEEVIQKLHEGKIVALITDAGTPGISDPGNVLVRRAIEENIPLIAIPGPSALTAALSISGLPSEEFLFIGFLPAKSEKRKKHLRGLALEKRTLIFYEAPHRIIDVLDEMAEILGKRNAVVVREITKLHEQSIMGSLNEIANNLRSGVTAGEFVVMVEGRTFVSVPAEEDVMDEIHNLMKKGLGRKDAVRKVADEYGLSRKELYDKSLFPR